eukprot:745508-Hanusia_phi.AAC.4
MRRARGDKYDSRLRVGSWRGSSEVLEGKWVEVIKRVGAGEVTGGEREGRRKRDVAMGSHLVYEDTIMDVFLSASFQTTSTKDISNWEGRCFGPGSTENEDLMEM